MQESAVIAMSVILEATLYNQADSMEWQGSAGEVDACGGDAIYRIGASARQAKFNEAMIAGEEADLCLRLALSGLAVDALDQSDDYS